MSMFDIFGDHTDVISRPKAKIANRLQHGNENFGKTFSSGSYAAPLKPNEPLKKCENNKKSFLLNKGKALQSTPLKMGTPFSSGLNNMNKQPLKIYSDYQETENTKTCDNSAIELEFHKPSYEYDNVKRDIFDDMPMFSYAFEPLAPEPRQRTPEPKVAVSRSVELNYSCEDEFFNDDFSNDSIVTDDFDPPSY